MISCGTLMHFFGNLRRRAHKELFSNPSYVDSSRKEVSFFYRLRMPEWLKVDIPHGKKISKMTDDLRGLKLHTVGCLIFYLDAIFCLENSNKNTSNY